MICHTLLPRQRKKVRQDSIQIFPSHVYSPFNVSRRVNKSTNAIHHFYPFFTLFPSPTFFCYFPSNISFCSISFAYLVYIFSFAYTCFFRTSLSSLNIAKTSPGCRYPDTPTTKGISTQQDYHTDIHNLSDKEHSNDPK